MDLTTGITILLLGLGNGSVFAALGVSLSIAYRTSNVINFGAGSMALFGAISYRSLRVEHSLYNPLSSSRPVLLVIVAIVVVGVGSSWLRNGLPSWPRVALLGGASALLTGMATQPTLISVGVGLTTPVALAVTMGVCALTGWVLYAVIFRPLRNALPLTQTVAAVGLLVLVPGLVSNTFGAGAIRVPSIFPTSVRYLGDVLIRAQQVYIAGAVICVAGALGLLYRRSRFGVQTAAAAESDVGATILGISPNRIGGLNWAICGAVAGIFGALIVSFVPVAPNDFALFVISGLAAAMLGRMTSLGWATFGGLIIGMLQAESQYLTTQWSFLPQQGFTDFIPLVLLVAVMLLRSKPLPERGALIRRSLPPCPAPRNVLPWAVGLTLASLILALTLTGDYQIAVVASLINCLLALSLVVLTGFAGQISLAQLMFAGVSAFLLSRLTVDWGVPFPVAPILAVLAVAVLGAIVSLPAVRVRGVNLAILTLAAGITVQHVYFSNADLIGNGGSPTVARPELFGLELSIGTAHDYPRSAFSIMIILIAVPLVLGVVGLRRSSLGLQMLAVRANERAAAANGVDVRLIKMLAFVISAGIAGVAGTFLAYSNYGGISVASFDIFLSVSLVAAVYVAGISTVAGAVIAAVLASGGLIFVTVSDSLPALTAWYPVIAGLSLIATAISIPEGLAGRFREETERLSGRFPRWRTPSPAIEREHTPHLALASCTRNSSLPDRPASRAVGAVRDRHERE